MLQRKTRCVPLATIRNNTTERNNVYQLTHFGPLPKREAARGGTGGKCSLNKGRARHRETKSIRRASAYAHRQIFASRKSVNCQFRDVSNDERVTEHGVQARDAGGRARREEEVRGAEPKTACNVRDVGDDITVVVISAQ